MVKDRVLPKWLQAIGDRRLAAQQDWEGVWVRGGLRAGGIWGSGLEAGSDGCLGCPLPPPQNPIKKRLLNTPVFHSRLLFWGCMGAAQGLVWNCPWGNLGRYPAIVGDIGGFFFGFYKYKQGSMRRYWAIFGDIRGLWGDIRRYSAILVVFSWDSTNTNRGA